MDQLRVTTPPSCTGFVLLSHAALPARQRWRGCRHSLERQRVGSAAAHRTASADWPTPPRGNAALAAAAASFAVSLCRNGGSQPALRPRRARCSCGRTATVAVVPLTETAAAAACSRRPELQLPRTAVAAGRRRRGRPPPRAAARRRAFAAHCRQTAAGGGDATSLTVISHAEIHSCCAPCLALGSTYTGACGFTWEPKTIHITLWRHTLRPWCSLLMAAQMTLAAFKRCTDELR